MTFHCRDSRTLGVRRRLQPVSESAWRFECPGCKWSHVIDDSWEFNGDLEHPTFSPSYLAWNDPNPNALPEYDPDGRYRNGFRCHSFIREGRIEFLSDCTHELAGQTVDLPEVGDGL